MSKELIETYAAGADKLAMAIRGLSKEDLAWKPPADANAGKWSIQEIVIHMMDSDCVSADRMKRIIADRSAQLLAYEENDWAANLAYEKRSVEDALQIFALVRKDMLVILKNLPAEAWQRTGVHTEAGRMTLTQYMQRTIKHLDHHLEFVHAQRRLMGKEMW